MCLVHHWSRRIDSNNGHTTYTCADCPATVDFTAARDEYDRREAQSPEEIRWPLERAKAS